MKNKLYFISTLLLLSMIHVSCELFDDEVNEFPITQEEIIKSVKNTKQIIKDANSIIEDHISSAYYSDALINLEQLRAQISEINNVEDAKLTPSGSGIVVKQNDGTYTNLLIVKQDEDRLFIESSSKSSTFNNEKIFVNKYKGDPIIPNGDAKALILAPFQGSLEKDIDQLKQLLQSAGYETDIFEDSEASLDKFNGDFLNRYDVIFIDTHGAANFRTRGGDSTTVLLTGEEFSSERVRLLSEEEQRAITTGGHDNKSYFAITSQWLDLTTTSDFSNSWFFASACESAMIDSGSASMSETLLNLGVIGYNGYDESINSDLASPIAEKMMARFTSGLTFNDASDEVRDDWGLLAKAWYLRLTNGSDDDDAINVNLFDNNKDISESFYIVNPDDVVGVAQLIPDSGVVGTNVIYEVIVNDNYTSQVASIEFDIDNTGEHLSMSKINSNTWQRDDLIAPVALSYPRIDTFTFSAFDSSGSLIGQSSATFSILESSTKQEFNNTKYYAK